MGLRAQVLVLGLLVLLLPVLGWQSIRQLHVALQQERIEAQTQRVGTLRAVLLDSPALAERLAIGREPSRPGASVGAVADVSAEASAEARGEDTDASSPDWFAESAPWPLFVDGYADDWKELVGGVLEAGALTLRVARRGERLFLFVRVRDENVVHHLPPRLDADAGENERPDREALRVNGDALELFVERPDGRRTHALLRVIAPGPVQVLRADAAGDTVPPDSARSPLRRWRAEWVDGAEGYQVEIELPLPATGSRVGIAAVDVARTGGARDRWAGTMDPAAMREAPAASGRGGVLFHESAALRARLRPWISPGTRARLFDERGLLIAEADALYAPSRGDGGRGAADGGAEADDVDAPLTPGALVGLLDALLLRLFAWFAAGDLPLFAESDKRRQPLHLDAARLAAADPLAPTTRYVTVDNDRVLGTLLALPLGERRAHLLFESNEEHASAFTGSRLARLFALLVLVSLALTLLLFAWATRLSLRIRRLARDAAAAIDAEGRVEPARRAAPLSESGARDEIGALSRDLAALLARSAAYTRYLERLSSRLSHELGTPLSIVRSSLENVDASRLDSESRTLVGRAESGAERLAHIVRALLDSTRLEQSVRRAAFEPLELGAWLEEAAAQYAQVHPGHRFRVVRAFAALDDPPARRAAERTPLRARVAAALLQQALDKLVDNAVDFATEPDIALVLTRERPDERTRRRADDARTGCATLAVANVGPPLGEEGARRAFEPAWSSRAAAGARGGEGVHDGLGLHLVALVAEAHGGGVLAFDRPVPGAAASGATACGSRVVVGLRWPLDRRDGES